jgi:uncharacterized protein YciI
MPATTAAVGRLKINIGVDILNNAELRANAQHVLASTRAARPKNTTRAYEPKQIEFQAFCRRKRYRDADTVTEEKLLLFLVEDVTDRPLKAKSRKVAADIPHKETRLAWRSVRGYVTALTDLYRAQKAMGMNNHPSPREDNVREYIRALQRRDAQRDREQFADKGRDTLLDGYTQQQFEAVCRELWAGGRSSPECSLRTLVDVLLGHYMLTRGGDRRAAEISDLFTFEFTGEGSTRCMPLIFTTRESKQNQHGRLETIGALRHKNPLICMLSGLAFYLLYRWDLTDEPFPDFASRKAWYGIRLIKRSAGGDRWQPLSYTSQREYAAKAFQQVGVFSSKTTHIGRPSAAKLAELVGVSEEQIRRAGRWNQDQMLGCYLNSLPREFMRKMAGHPAQAGCFEIRRARAAPPSSLLALIWPELDTWRDRFGPNPGQINDLAAAGFTDLLFYLREVILQDSVALRPRFPDNAIWTHSVFQHEAYEKYAQEVIPLLHEGESELSLLYKAMPQLIDYLRTMEARNNQHIAEIKSLVDTVSSQVDTVSSQAAQAKKAAQAAHLAVQQAPQQLLTAGSLTLRLDTPASAASAASASASATATATAANTATAATAVSMLTIAESSCMPSQYASARTSTRGSPAPTQQLPLAEAVPPLPPPSYRMSRAVKTVDQLWREWTVGLGGGSPAVAALDSAWGSRWRAGRRSELQWYSLRLEVIKEIERIAQAQRCSAMEAMWQLNLQQQRTGASLDQLCKRLRASRKTLAAAIRSR